MARETDLTRLIIEEAIKRWRRGTVKDELAPSLTVCLLGHEEPRWYVSLVRYVKRDRKRVERRTEAATFEQALETIAAGFIPAGLDANVDHRAEMINREQPAEKSENPKVRRLADRRRTEFPQWCGGQCGGAVEGCDVCG